MKNEAVLDENYRKAGKMDLECFALLLDPIQTDLIKTVHGYLLEGAPSTIKMKPELYKLNVYGSHAFFYFNLSLVRREMNAAAQVRDRFSSHTSIPRAAK